jgi:hypothetical protein
MNPLVKLNFQNNSSLRSTARVTMAPAGRVSLEIKTLSNLTVNMSRKPTNPKKEASLLIHSSLLFEHISKKMEIEELQIENVPLSDFEVNELSNIIKKNKVIKSIRVCP